MNGPPNQREQHLQTSGGRTENQEEARFEDLRHRILEESRKAGDVLIHHF